MEKQTVFPANASAVKGPYSPAVVCGDWVFVSGQIPADPETGELTTGPIEDKARRVFDNLKLILESAGSDLSKTVKVTLYLADMSKFAAVNAVYAEYFGPDYPARACVQVSGLPLGVDLEADVIAVR
jgi:2-iminobutanoate/2-iminopropanoate deaminase